MPICFFRLSTLVNNIFLEREKLCHVVLSMQVLEFFNRFMINKNPEEI